jgi:hypothetical protein
MAKGSAKMTVTSLRSLLGWLHIDGVLSQSLAWAVTSVASWRLARLPQLLEPDQVQAMDIINAFTDLERQLASPEGDTRSSEPGRPVPPR